jgi:hypothetical protein
MTGWIHTHLSCQLVARLGDLANGLGRGVDVNDEEDDDSGRSNVGHRQGQLWPLHLQDPTKGRKEKKSSNALPLPSSLSLGHSDGWAQAVARRGGVVGWLRAG